MSAEIDSGNASSEISDSIEVTPQGATGADQIDSVLARGFRWLQFPAPLEQHFVDEYVQKWRRHEVISAIVALLLFDSFLLTDQQMIPDIYAMAVKVRLLGVSPLILFGIFMHLRGWNPSVRQAYMAVVSVLCACTLIWFQSLTHSATASYYFIGAPLIVIYTNVVQRVRFWYALGASLISVAFCVTWESRISVVPPVAIQSFGLVMFTTVVLTMIASYRLEHDERFKFLLRQRDESQRRRERQLMKQLGRANLKLERLSNTDALTGVSNRRRFDEQFAELWKTAESGRTPLSLLLFDVDFFKLYNDQYGHPAGDECLRHVAAAVKSALRESADLIARYGGEEFAVILPATDAAASAEIAERVRRAVMDLSLPHANSMVAPTVTISIGVATAIPDRDGTAPTPAKLLETADMMLYQAKIAGRNRIWSIRDFNINGSSRSIAA